MSRLTQVNAAADLLRELTPEERALAMDSVNERVRRRRRGGRKPGPKPGTKRAPTPAKKSKKGGKKTNKPRLIAEGSDSDE